MKQRNLILSSVLLLALATAAYVLIARPNTGRERADESMEQLDSDTQIPATAVQVEPATPVIAPPDSSYVNDLTGISLGLPEGWYGENISSLTVISQKPSLMNTVTTECCVPIILVISFPSDVTDLDESTVRSLAETALENGFSVDITDTKLEYTGQKQIGSATAQRYNLSAQVRVNSQELVGAVLHVAGNPFTTLFVAEAPVDEWALTESALYTVVSSMVVPSLKEVNVPVTVPVDSNVPTTNELEVKDNYVTTLVNRLDGGLGEAVSGSGQDLFWLNGFEAHNHVFEGRQGIRALLTVSFYEQNMMPIVVLAGTDGQVLANPEPVGSGSAVYVIDIELPSDGDFIVRVASTGPIGGSYEISLTLSQG